MHNLFEISAFLQPDGSRQNAIYKSWTRVHDECEPIATQHKLICHRGPDCLPCTRASLDVCRLIHCKVSRILHLPCSRGASSSRGSSERGSNVFTIRVYNTRLHHTGVPYTSPLYGCSREWMYTVLNLSREWYTASRPWCFTHYLLGASKMHLRPRNISGRGRFSLLQAVWPNCTLPDAAGLHKLIEPFLMRLLFDLVRLQQWRHSTLVRPVSINSC